MPHEIETVSKSGTVKPYGESGLNALAQLSTKHVPFDSEFLNKWKSENPYQFDVNKSADSMFGKYDKSSRIGLSSYINKSWGSKTGLTGGAFTPDGPDVKLKKKSSWDWGGNEGNMASALGFNVLGSAGQLAAAKMGEDANINYDNIYESVDQKKMTNASTLSGTATGAKVGASIGAMIPLPFTGLIGGAIGGIVGLFTGLFTGKKKAREEEENRVRLARKSDIARMKEDQQKISRESQELTANANARYSKKEHGGKFRYISYRYALNNVEGSIKHIERRPVLKLFKRGGKLNEAANIIPNGVSHEEENSLGTKGMPVIKCGKSSCEKVYEIESNELILTLSTTKAIEQLAEDGDLEALGDFVVTQLLDNTHSFTKKYEYLN